MNAHVTKHAQSNSLEPSRLGHLSSSDIGMQDALGLNRQTRCAMDATEHQLKPKDSTLATAAQKTKPPSVPKAAIDTRDESDVPQVPSSLSPRIAAALKQSALSYPAFVHQLLASAFAGVQCWELQDLERLFWLSEHLGLDPLQRDIIAIESPTNLRYPIAFMVTLDGWVKLLHRHALFRGLEFHEGPEDQDGMPQWVSCTIYWEGFHCPWKVHEWATENRTDSPAWTTHPRRMLRHKALSQCARLAVGLGGGVWQGGQEVNGPPSTTHTDSRLEAIEESGSGVAPGNRPKKRFTDQAGLARVLGNL